MNKQMWVPVEHGKQEVCLGQEYFIVSLDGRVLDLRHRDGESSWPITLYSDIRLCRLVATEGQVTRMPTQEVADIIRGALNEAAEDAGMNPMFYGDATEYIRRVDAALAWLAGLAENGGEGGNGS